MLFSLEHLCNYWPACSCVNGSLAVDYHNIYSPFKKTDAGFQTEGVISGVVNDRLGKPISAVTVKVVGSDKDTSTDEKGRFTITVERRSSLE